MIFFFHLKLNLASNLNGNRTKKVIHNNTSATNTRQSNNVVRKQRPVNNGTPVMVDNESPPVANHNQAYNSNQSLVASASSSSNSSSVLSSPITNQQPLATAKTSNPQQLQHMPLQSKSKKILVQKSQKSRPIINDQPSTHHEHHQLAVSQPAQPRRAAPQKREQTNPAQKPVVNQNHYHHQSIQNPVRMVSDNNKKSSKQTMRAAATTTAVASPIADSSIRVAKSAKGRRMPVSHQDTNGSGNNQIVQLEDNQGGEYECYQNEAHEQQNDSAAGVIVEEQDELDRDGEDDEQEPETYDDQEEEQEEEEEETEEVAAVQSTGHQECYLEENEAYYEEEYEEEHGEDETYEPEDMEEDELDIDQNKSACTYSISGPGATDNMNGHHRCNNNQSSSRKFIQQNLKRVYNSKQQYQEMQAQPASSRIVHQAQQVIQHSHQTDFIYSKNSTTEGSKTNGKSRQVVGTQNRNPPTSSRPNGKLYFSFVRFAKCKTRRIVSEVKIFFTTVFSVFQNLDKPTWLSKKK
jgi:hypothetical protein